MLHFAYDRAKKQQPLDLRPHVDSVEYRTWRLHKRRLLHAKSESRPAIAQPCLRPWGASCSPSTAIGRHRQVLALSTTPSAKALSYPGCPAHAHYKPGQTILCFHSALNLFKYSQHKGAVQRSSTNGSVMQQCPVLLSEGMDTQSTMTRSAVKTSTWDKAGHWLADEHQQSNTPC